MTRGSVVKSLYAAAIAALLVCALAAFSGAAESADGVAEPAPPAASPDAAVGAPPLAGAPDGGMSHSDRRRFRRVKRFGIPAQSPDTGGNVDAGAHDAVPMRLAVRDAGVRPFVPPPPPVVAPRPPPPPPPTGPSTSLPVTEMGFNTCQKIPAGKRAVKVNLKPDIELPELVAWISSVTCKAFVLPGHLSAAGKKLTFVTQGAMTPNEAYATFISALDSIGLTVERGPGYYKIIESSKAKSGAGPVYGFDGRPAQAAPRPAKPSGASD